jgi:hypothetical protein
MKRLCIYFLLSISLSVYGLSPADTAKTTMQGLQRLADSSATDQSSQGVQQPKKIKIIKKDINYSTFIKLAIGMMGFIALILTTTQNYNPS